jgi:hypothetical protein
MGLFIPICIWAIRVRKREEEETKKEAEKQRKALVAKKIETWNRALSYIDNLEEGTTLSFTLTFMNNSTTEYIRIVKITDDSITYEYPFSSSAPITKDKKSFALHYGELIINHVEGSRKNKEEVMKQEALRIVMEKLKVGDRICYFKKEWAEELATKDSYLIIQQVDEYEVRYGLEGVKNSEYCVQKTEFADKFFLGILEAYYNKTGD